MGSRQIVLVSTAGISVLNGEFSGGKLKQKGFFHSVGLPGKSVEFSGEQHLISIVVLKSLGSIHVNRFVGKIPISYVCRFSSESCIKTYSAPIPYVSIVL